MAKIKQLQVCLIVCLIKDEKYYKFIHSLAMLKTLNSIDDIKGKA